MTLRLRVLTVLAAASMGGCGSAARDEPPDRGESARALPLVGTAPSGDRYRLAAAKPDRDEDVATTWCLKLGYGPENDFLQGAKTCGERGGPPVGGLLQVDCDDEAVFAFGGRETGSGRVELAPERGNPIAAQEAAVPAGMPFEGTVFLVAAQFGDLPADLREQGSDGPPLIRVPAADEVCRGVPDNAQPFAEFPEGR